MNDDKPDYTLKVKGIINILLREYEEKHARLCNLCSWGDGDLTGKYFSEELWSVKNQIENILTYEEAGNFTSLHYHLSLEDWINTL
jgi:hypothetical protein